MGGAADFSLLGMWKSMGIPARLVVIVLAIMSIYSLSVMAERLFSFARAKEQSRRYAEKLRDLLPGHQLVEAARSAASIIWCPGKRSRSFSAYLRLCSLARANEKSRSAITLSE